MDALSEANGTFALTLLKKLGEGNSKNVFISPLSISSALAMVLLGAKGNTAAQMCQTLSLNKSSGGGEDVHQGFQNLLSEVNRRDTQYLLRTANRLFGEKTYDFLSSFKDSCRKFYQAEMEELDFVCATEESRKHINTWVAEKTEGQELNMVILLPSESTDLNTVEKALTYEKFIAWTKPDVMDEEEVEVSLPRFTLEASYDMEEFLRDLGVTDAFEEARADFSGMSSGRGLHLSKVMHKSFVEVTEEGTEAAAATGAVVMMRCLMVVPRFNADHPFLFFIQHSRTGAILFCGRFCSP